ncbi:MAG: T9SS type A sorting domain-containing protein, partial [Flavobacteriales bacterium]
MKKTITFLSLLSTLVINAQTTHDLFVSDFEFSPAFIEAIQGDSLRIVPLDSGHTFTQVDDVTWDANGNTPSGLFQFDPLLDSITVELTGSGTIYYVCSPHASTGMKGIVEVALASSVMDHSLVRASAFYPNPASEMIRLRDPSTDVVDVSILDAVGREAARMQVISSEPLYVGDLPDGLYTLRVMDSAGIHTEFRRPVGA